MRRTRRWLRHGILGVLGVVLALGLMGWLWERSEEAAYDPSAVEPVGEMVGAPGRALHVVAQGEGTPGVLLISGLGDDFRGWREIQRPLADSTRVVSYDRPGLGLSPPREELPTLDAALDDIEALVTSPQLFDGPPVLVGHSLGGLIAREFAHTHPSLISGLVLVDPTPPRMPGVAVWVGGLIYRLGALSGGVGWTRWRFYRANPDFPRDEIRRWAHTGAGGRAARNVRREFVGARASEPRELAPGALRDLPLVVLSAPAAAPPMLGRIGEALDSAKRGMAQESRAGRVVDVATGHYVHREAPGVVLDAILAVLRTARGPRGES